MSRDARVMPSRLAGDSRQVAHYYHSRLPAMRRHLMLAQGFMARLSAALASILGASVSRLSSPPPISFRRRQMPRGRAFGSLVWSPARLGHAACRSRYARPEAQLYRHREYRAKAGRRRGCRHMPPQALGAAAEQQASTNSEGMRHHRRSFKEVARHDFASLLAERPQRDR